MLAKSLVYQVPVVNMFLYKSYRMTRLLLLVVAIASVISADDDAAKTPKAGRTKPKTVITPVNAVVMRIYEVAMLQCTGANVIAWYQVSTNRLLTNELTDERGLPDKYIITDSTLNITRVGRNDVGDYVCYDGNTRANYTVQLFMKPTFTKPLPRSLNMAEGDEMILFCNTFGWPLPTVNWIRSNPETNFLQPLTANVTLADARIVANGSMLTITPATKADYMLYTCVSTNDIGAVNSTSLVRVKGKYTAIWPFMGIVVQAIILVVIIMVFEKKKAKEIQIKRAQQQEEEASLLKTQTKRN